MRKTKLKGNFSQVPNAFLKIQELSASSKLIVIYLMSKPPNWKPKIYDIVKSLGIGVKGVRNSLKQLRNNGYARLEKVRAGKKVYWHYSVSFAAEFPKTLDCLIINNQMDQNAPENQTKTTKKAVVPFGQAPQGEVPKGHAQKGHPLVIKKVVKKKEEKKNKPTTTAALRAQEGGEGGGPLVENSSVASLQAAARLQNFPGQRKPDSQELSSQADEVSNQPALERNQAQEPLSQPNPAVSQDGDIEDVPEEGYVRPEPVETVPERVIRKISAIYTRFFAVAPEWSRPGKMRVYAFYDQYPEYAKFNSNIWMVLIKAWELFDDLSQEESVEKAKTYYFCNQILDVNEIFKIHTYHEKVMLLGAAQELKAKLSTTNIDASRDYLTEAGYEDLLAC